MTVEHLFLPLKRHSQASVIQPALSVITVRTTRPPSDSKIGASDRGTGGRGSFSPVSAALNGCGDRMVDKDGKFSVGR